MDRILGKFNINGVQIDIEETVDGIEDNEVLATKYIFIEDEYGNHIVIEDGMIKSGKINHKEFYNNN